MTLIERIAALEGACVTQICFDYAVTVRFDVGELRVEGPFAVAGETVEFRFDAEKPDLAHTGTLVALHQQHVVAATLEDESTLGLAFDGGLTLTCPPQECWEAWTLWLGPDLYVCSPR